MEKNLDKLNNKTMKEVWDHYNKKLKHKSHVRIKLDTEQEQAEFMQFWHNLYQDNRKNIDMRVIKDEIIHNYPIQETEGPTFEEVNEIM